MTIHTNNLLNFSIVTVEKLDEIFEKYKVDQLKLAERIINLDLMTLNYDNVFNDALNLDDNTAHENQLMDMGLLYPDLLIKQKCTELSQDQSKFNIELGMRKDVYKVIKHYYNNQFLTESALLSAEQITYVKKVIVGYEMLGLDLNESDYERVKEINKELSSDSSNFKSNLSNVLTEFMFDKTQLDGMDELWLKNKFDEESLKYKIKLQYPDYIPIMEYCKIRETRKLMSEAMNSRCVDTNLNIILNSVNLRQERAKLFGFKSHSDYKLQNQMARDASTVNNFLSNLVDLIKPIAKTDLTILQSLALADSIDQLAVHDIPYYTRIHVEKESVLDMKDLQKLFTIESVTNGIFKIYQKLLGFKFVEITNEHPDSIYSPDVKLFCVYNLDDSIQGYFYLDLFPRDGKFGHAAMFTLILKSSNNLPVSAIVCNFDPKLNVEFDNVVTYFHEFGHLMHNISSTNAIGPLSGVGCERDFVETPSQMFEEWCYCLEPLKLLCVEEFINEITPELVAKINKQNHTMQGIFYARQLSFGLLDMALHGNTIPHDTWSTYNDIYKNLVGVEISSATNILASWGHMFGYDSSYYGYMWSKVYSIDLFSFFKDDVMNEELGRKLKKEILSYGGTYDGFKLMRQFTNRDPNPNAFIDWLLQN